MRRLATAVAVMVFVALGILGATKLPARNTQPTTDPIGTIASRFAWIVSSPGTDTGATYYGNSCAPAYQAACQQVLDSVTGVLIQTTAGQIVQAVNSITAQ